MLKVENLKKQYFDVLFEQVTFLLGNHEKVGLIGLNGCGKTTLLKILAGEEKADEGTITLVKEKIGYLPQEFTFPKNLLVGEFLENLVYDPYNERYKIDTILNKLSAGSIDDFQYIETLSEGEKMKLKLAELLLQGATILLLDEPTNHLDIEGIIWFEKFIQNFKGICIIISHDREFLNNTIDTIFEIDEKHLHIFQGNYDDYLLGKEKYLEERRKEFLSQERKRQKLEILIKHAGKIKNGKKRGKALKAAKSRLKREVLTDEKSKYQEIALKNISINGSVHSNKKIIEVDKLHFNYGKKQILKQASFKLFGQEKVWFLGPNGIGKTTFLNLILGKLKAVKGSIRWGENISYSFFSQNQQHLDMEASVEDFFMQSTGIPYENSFGVLERFLFPKELRYYKLKALSPGQRARLSFAVFAQHEYKFLLLDEPTNHLDIKTKEVIEEALYEFKGALLLISHDRYFVKNIGINRIITLEDKKIAEITHLE